MKERDEAPADAPGRRVPPAPARPFLRFDSPGEVAVAATEHVLRAAEQAIAARGRFSLVLSGGSTPLPMFRRLAREARNPRVDWSAVDVFWADERDVPVESRDSNYGTALRFVLRHLPIPRRQIHPILIDGDPEGAARACTETLADFAAPAATAPTPGPIFDLTLLGMGADGHTASIFPGSHAHRLALDGAGSKLAVPATSPTPPTVRVTLTAHALNRSRAVVFLVTGGDKRDAVRRVFDEVDEPLLPAALIRPIGGPALWLLDHAAAPVDPSSDPPPASHP